MEWKSTAAYRKPVDYTLVGFDDEIGLAFKIQSYSGGESSMICKTELIRSSKGPECTSDGERPRYNSNIIKIRLFQSYKESEENREQVYQAMKEEMKQLLDDMGKIGFRIHYI